MSTVKTFRVLFSDTTYWEAFIEARDEATALQIAEDNWNEAGTEGFTPEQRLDIASDGSCSEFLEADEVQS